MMKQLKRNADLAYQILSNKNIGYYINKENIRKIFDYTDKNEGYTKNAVIIQLTVIDSYYSTQMNKRYYGIEELAEKIIDISSSKENFNNKLISFLKEPSKKSDIYELFNMKYGIHKDFNSAGMAVSLISKFAYYQTEFKFPIYDNLVRNIYPLILKKYFKNDSDFDDYNTKGKIKDFIKFYKAIRLLNQKSEIVDYNKLDNLLWLSGKISENSFSIILSKKDYIESLKNKFNKEKKQIIIENIDTLNMNKEIKEFMRFVDNLNDN